MNNSKKELVVHVSREPFMDWYTLCLDDGSSEEIQAEDCMEWFKLRGADMIAVERALDYIWNFYHGTIVIENPKDVHPKNPAIQPKLG
jgi:hypothetical protein